MYELAATTTKTSEKKNVLTFWLAFNIIIICRWEEMKVKRNKNERKIERGEKWIWRSASLGHKGGCQKCTLQVNNVYSLLFFFHSFKYFLFFLWNILKNDVFPFWTIKSKRLLQMDQLRSLFFYFNDFPSLRIYTCAVGLCVFSVFVVFAFVHKYLHSWWVPTFCHMMFFDRSWRRRNLIH